MAKIEVLEMGAHREQLKSDVSGLVNKYRAIFGWDVPEIDEDLSDDLIFQAMHQALDEIQAPTDPP